MNPELPNNPREQLELRVTALLLGELSALEAEAMRDAMAKDPTLQTLHDDLKQTIHLIREATAGAGGQDAEVTEPLQLAEGRRQALRAAFTIPPLKPQHVQRRQRHGIRLIELLVVISILGIAASLLLPALGRSKAKAKSVVVISNVRKLDLAKLMWAEDNKKPADAAPTMEDLQPYLAGRSALRPVSGERYVLGKAGEPVVAQMDAKDARQHFGRLPKEKVGDTDASTVSISSDGSVYYANQQIPQRGREPAAKGVAGVPTAVGFVEANTPTVEQPGDTLRPMKIALPDLAQTQGNMDVPTFPGGSSISLSGKSGNLETLYRTEGQRSGGRGGSVPVPSAGTITDEVLYESVTRQAQTIALRDKELASAGSSPQLSFGMLGEGRSLDRTDESRRYSDDGSGQTDTFYGAPHGNRGGLVHSDQPPASLGLPLVTSESSSAAGYKPDSDRAEWFGMFKDNIPQAQSSGVGLAPQETDLAHRSAAEDRELNFAQGLEATDERRDATSHSDLANNFNQKKRELETLLAFQRLLETRVTKELVDKSLPRSAMVAITDRAVPETNPSMLGSLAYSLGRDYEATVKMKLAENGADIQEFGSNRAQGSYDPYFVQPEFEAMKSDAVLTNVVANLNLTKKWGDISTDQAVQKLRGNLELKAVPNTMFTEIKARSSDAQEAADLANAVAEAYRARRLSETALATESGIRALKEQFDEQQEKIERVRTELAQLEAGLAAGANEVSVPQSETDAPLPRQPGTNAPIPQPEIQTSQNNFSTFSLNVSEVSFKLAAASLEQGQLPPAASIRSEEFINAFDYRDPQPADGSPIAFAWERARYPFAHNRDLLRFSLKTAASGREAGRPLNLVLLLDNSGSMERADRVQIIRAALRVLAAQLQPQDKLSVISFARTPRLVADGVSGDEAGKVTEAVAGLAPQGGTNLEDAMNLAYQTARRHYLADGINRVVVMTDGAANLGNVEPGLLQQRVEASRKQGIALDCFGIGWEGYNDDLLEVLARNGDGRYGFINTPAEAATDFAGQLAGALKVAASDVKVQVEFNPARVTSYRQIGYAKHQLTQEQFRDNTVDAAEIAAQEAGNALYTLAVNPAGTGPLGTVLVRYKVPGSTDYRELAWDVPYTGNAGALEQASPAMRLAASAGAFSEWLAASPYAGEVRPAALLNYLTGVPEVFGADPRPKKLEWMIRQASNMAGN